MNNPTGRLLAKATSFVRTVAVAGLSLLTLTPAAAAQDAAGMDLQATTELSFVATGGNALSNTLGLKSALTGTSEGSSFKIDIGGIRAESKFRTLKAIGTADDFDVDETIRTEHTAASYFARGRYDKTFGPAFGFGSAGWTRNTFAGVKNRFSFALGAGRTWVEGDGNKFKTDLAATYTVQKDVSPSPTFDDSFLGVRVTVDALRQVTETTQLATVLTLDQNGEKTEDFRAEWETALSVAISEGLALKTSLQLLFDNDPSLIGVPLESLAGVPAGEKVLVAGEGLDRVLTVALVISL